MNDHNRWGFTFRVFRDWEDGHYGRDWVAVVDQPLDWCRYLSAIDDNPVEALRQLIEEVLPAAWEVLSESGE